MCHRDPRDLFITLRWLGCASYLDLSTLMNMIVFSINYAIDKIITRMDEALELQFLCHDQKSLRKLVKGFQVMVAVRYKVVIALQMDWLSKFKNYLETMFHILLHTSIARAYAQSTWKYSPKVLIAFGTSQLSPQGQVMTTWL